jgi:hypothetical protein
VKDPLSRIAKLCRDNIAAFGKSYDPRYPAKPGQAKGRPMTGAKAEGAGVAACAEEVLAEIRAIRRENRRQADSQKELR